MSTSQHTDTCPLHNTMIHVRFTTHRYMSTSQHTDTCPLHNTMIHVCFTTHRYMSTSQHNDTCPLQYATVQQKSVACKVSINLPCFVYPSIGNADLHSQFLVGSARGEQKVPLSSVMSYFESGSAKIANNYF